jgi:competence/damage-inducible protein CinA-like protein
LFSFWREKKRNHPFATLKPVIAEIIAIGSELLTPFRQDTNSLFLTARLNEFGVTVAFKSIVGDDRGHLTSVARIALRRADIVIFMGGLGPTEDDLTRECVAEALGRPLHRDTDIIAALYARFAGRQIRMTPNNEQQADVIEGATALPNANGSAPGQWLVAVVDGRERIIVLLPGPPWELEALFKAEVMPRLREKLPPANLARRVLKIAMIGESSCDQRIAPIYKQYTDVQTTILAGAGDIELQLQAQRESLDEAQARVDELADKIEDELGDLVYSNRGESLEQIVGYYLQMRGATLATAESCTGGLIGARITSISGSSRYYLGGAITYSNDLKSSFAGVPPLMIQAHGAVSREVAAAMAEGIRHDCNATLGLAVTGIAGPMGGTEEKPIGLVYHALHDGDRTEVIERKFMGDRDRIRRWAAQQALDMVRRRLI